MPKSVKPDAAVTLLKPDKGYDWRCQRCGHQWRSRTPDAPVPMQCAHCRSAYWSRPRSSKGAKRVGRHKARMAAVPVKTEPEAGFMPQTVWQGVLPPPPHLRNQIYRQPEPGPAPENMIMRHGEHNVRNEAPDDWIPGPRPTMEHTIERREPTDETTDETQESQS